MNNVLIDKGKKGTLCAQTMGSLSLQINAIIQHDLNPLIREYNIKSSKNKRLTPKTYPGLKCLSSFKKTQEIIETYISCWYSILLLKFNNFIDRAKLLTICI